MQRLERVQSIPATLESAWNFFSRPENLALITPPWLGFRLISPPASEPIYPGQLLSYRLRPLLGVPIRWTSEITHCREPYLFVDEQRFGPYRFWQHQHHFRPIPGGIEVRDLVHYRLPFGPFGLLAAGPVQRRLRAIFDYRQHAVQAHFAARPPAP